MSNRLANNSGVRNIETTHKPIVILRCKVVVVGDACVGKTALTQVFNTGGSSYPKNYIMVNIVMSDYKLCKNVLFCRLLVQNSV
jgi:GTPase SAR1 family protein